MAELVQATTPFACSLGGDPYAPYSVAAGDIFASDDEVVQRFGGNFRPLTIRASADLRRPLPAHPGGPRPGATETADAPPDAARHISTQAPAAPPPRRGKAGAATATPAPAGASEV